MRPYCAGGNDLANMLALVRAAWLPERAPDANFHIGDLCWRLRYPEHEQTLWLCEDDIGRLLAFAKWTAVERSLEIQVHPAYADNGVDSQVLAWAEQQPDVGGDPVGAVTTTFACDLNVPFSTFLADRGYARLRNWMNAHRRNLSSEIEAPHLPEGYIVRSLHGPEEMAARAEAHRAGWQSTLMTEAAYGRLMRTPAYRLDLDFVVVAPDGTIAANCNCWLDEQNGTGLFEPVSTHPDHRRKGLARAMIHYGVSRLRSLGAREAWVGSFSGNPVATRLYESCGMEIVRRDFCYKSRA